MGMDVYGANPVSEKGSYFRNNVWWWRPLWDYCLAVAPLLCDDVSGHTNDGDGLGASDAKALADLLSEEIKTGRCAEYEKRYNEWRGSQPRVKCELCDETGIRSDAVGIEHGMPDRELEPEVQILTGRTHGYCNGCAGVGTRESWNTQYPFTVENVQEFVDFLYDSGGFSIC